MLLHPCGEMSQSIFCALSPVRTPGLRDGGAWAIAEEFFFYEEAYDGSS